MQKQFLLLRNNRQTGPYSIEEILQLDLKPFDLVWVQNRSAAWQYPGEIPDLQGHVAPPPQPEVPFKPISTAALDGNVSETRPTYPSQVPVQKNIFVSMPKSARPVIQEDPAPASIPDPELPKTGYSAPGYTQAVNEPEGYAGYDHHADRYEKPSGSYGFREDRYDSSQLAKKKKSFSRKDLTATLLLLVVIAGGYYLLTAPAATQSSARKDVGVKTVLPVENNGSITSEPVNEAPNSQPPSLLPEEEATDLKNVSPNSITQPAKKSASLPKRPEEATVKKGDIISPVPNNEAPAGEGAVSEVKEENPLTGTEKTASAKKQKKKLGTVLKDIFSKPKTEPADEKLEEPKPAHNRQSAKREGSKTEAPAVTEEELASQIEISSNAGDNWMAGITGLKVTVRNRSNVVVRTAAVHVIYYDQNNKVLEKKALYFNNVPAGGKMTLPAPDHKFADHVGFNLAAVSAKDNSYAKE